jgi:hypothetical protein
MLASSIVTRFLFGEGRKGHLACGDYATSSWRKARTSEMPASTAALDQVGWGAGQLGSK